MLAHKLITELKSLGFTGSAGDMLKKYLRDRFTLPDAAINDLLKYGLNATDVNRALADLVADATDGLTPVSPTDPYFANVVSLLHFDPTASEDVYFGNTVLLMHMDGSDNGTTFTDVKGKTVTRTGTGNVTKTDIKKFGTASLLLVNTDTDYLSVADSVDFEFGSGDFTIECWVNFLAFPTTGLADIIFGKTYAALNRRGWSLNITEVSGSYELRMPVSSDGLVSTIAKGTITPSLNTWYHVAGVRTGNTLKVFFDGVEVGTNTFSGSVYDSTEPVYIGREGGNGTAMSGYIDDLRITKGVARYTTNFTPPAAAFPDAAGGLTDVKGKTWVAVGNAAATGVAKYGANSLAVDGVGDYIYGNGSSDFAFGTGDFTVEFWIKFNSFSGNQLIYDSRPTGADGQLYPSIYVSGTSLRFYTASADRITGSTVLVVGTWYHVAVCRSGTTTKLFLNGNQEGSSFAGDINNYINGATNRPIVGGSGYIDTNQVNASIDDFRVTKGVARYTANFTPPTAAFPDA